MRLVFTDKPRQAAEWLLRETHLAYHPFLDNRIAYDPHPTHHSGDALILNLPDDEPRWSTGERVVLDLLAGLSQARRPFDLTRLGEVDRPLRGVCLHAITTAVEGWLT